MKQDKTKTDAINLYQLVDHFSQKFSEPDLTTEGIQRAKHRVQAKYNSLINNSSQSESIFISEFQIKKYIKKLKGNTAAGYDGIMADHLKYALESKLPLLLSNMFTVCVNHGIIPDMFNNGLSVPLLKKPTLDPSVPGNYRPITISVVISKLLELYILDQCDLKVSEAQFGFSSGRNTNMAVTLAHDIGTHFVSNGSNVYYCSLDAEGAFDFLPHSVILNKAMDVVADHVWLLLYRC